MSVRTGGVFFGRQCAALNWKVNGSLLGDSAPRTTFSIFLTHANGFCKEMWLPVVQEFAEILQHPTPLLSQPLPPPIVHRHAPPCPIINPPTENQIADHISSSVFNFTSIDLPGHGDSQLHKPLPLIPSDEIGWEVIGEGVASTISECLDQEDVQEAVKEKTHAILGCGLSMGASSFLFANSIIPNTLDGLVLIEPIIPSLFGGSGAGTLSQAAKKRRAVFSSREEIEESYKSKPVFQDWDERALAQYVEHGFRKNSEGQLELKCPREVESLFFSGGFDNPTYVHKKLSSIECPVTLVHAENTWIASKPHLSWDDTIEMLQKVNGGYQIAGSGHLVCMSHPRETAFLLFDMIAKYLETSMNKSNL